MDRIHLALVACLALIGCNRDSVAPPIDTSVKREISASLRSQCPGLRAGRSSTDSLPLHPGFVKSNAVLDSIHDKEGKLVAVFEGTHLWSIDGPLYIAWDGKDASGAYAPAGNYFHFVEIRDTTGTVVRRDSACFTLTSGS